ncbi:MULTISPECIES: DUF6557 family protein [unclassified Carboxylicivirga]|uniref:DUF6557 family protein n=1 Tax=Carboxylicivirga TaxID=1628153 RepID=UPI003D33EDD4
MTLKELISQFQWSELEVRLPYLYPEQGKDLDGFKDAYSQLMSLHPVDSDMTIILTPTKEDWEETEYAHVNARYTIPKDEEQKVMTYSLMLTPWTKWLGMEVSEEAFAYYGKLDTLVHILWEMTFVGYKEESVTEFEEELMQQKLEYEEMTEEDKSESSLYSRLVKSCPDGKQIVTGKEKEAFEKFIGISNIEEVPSKEEYEKACHRMEELIHLVNNDTPESDPNFQELDRVSGIIIKYEEVHYPIPELTLRQRGFTGTVDWNDSDGLFYGQVKGIEPDLVSYEGKTLEDLEKDFKEALELYLEGKDKAKNHLREL